MGMGVPTLRFGAAVSSPSADEVVLSQAKPSDNQTPSESKEKKPFFLARFFKWIGRLIGDFFRWIGSLFHRKKNDSAEGASPSKSTSSSDPVPPPPVSEDVKRFTELFNGLGIKPKAFIAEEFKPDNCKGEGASYRFYPINRPGFEDYGLLIPLKRFRDGFFIQNYDFSLEELPDKATWEMSDDPAVDLDRVGATVAKLHTVSVVKKVPGQQVNRLYDDIKTNWSRQSSRYSYALTALPSIKIQDVQRRAAFRETLMDALRLGAKPVEEQSPQDFDRIKTIVQEELGEILREDRPDYYGQDKPSEALRVSGCSSYMVEELLQGIHTGQSFQVAQSAIRFIEDQAELEKQILEQTRQLTQYPLEAYVDAVNTLSTLKQRKVGMDFEHGGNVLWDEDGKRFGFVDLQPVSGKFPVASLTDFAQALLGGTARGYYGRYLLGEGHKQQMHDYSEQVIGLLDQAAKSVSGHKLAWKPDEVRQWMAESMVIA